MRIGKLAKADNGLTLIEVLVTIVILGIITAALGRAVISYVKYSNATSDRLAQSHDAQVSAAYFAQDVASFGMRDYTANGTPMVSSIQVNAAYNAGGKTCGTAATPVALVRFLSDDWDSASSPPVLGTDVVAYYLSGTALRRMKCVRSTTAASDVIVAHYVDPATLSLTCVNGCGAADVPQVTLAFTVIKPAVAAYPVTLNGQRRQTA